MREKQNSPSTYYHRYPSQAMCQDYSHRICFRPDYFVSLHRQEEHTGVPLFLFSIHQEPPTSPLRDPQPPKGGFFILKWACKRATFASSFGLFQLLTTAFSQSRLGLVKNWIGQMERIRRMESGGQMNLGKIRVMLFLKV